MAKRKRRNFTPSFRTEVVLEAFSGESSQVEVCQRHNFSDDRLSVGRRKQMPNPKTKPYTKALKEIMSRKSEILSKAQALSDIGTSETAQSLWLSAATYEEHIAPMLDGLGRELEGAIHRISAASCYEKAGNLARAVNLYRAALSGPLHDD